ncbi:hypothetical protein HDU83_009233, partial [Entophlyctis luteolus]
MANSVLFVKYADNQPVKIKTLYEKQGVRREDPLLDVADVIVAVQQALPSKLGAIDPDELTLHCVVDGVEGPALEPDYLISNLTAGVTAKTALVIKSRRDMEVFRPFDPTSYRLAFPFFVSPDCDEHLTLLGRDEVVRRINQVIDNRSGWPKYMPFIISTSRGMGKTFLLKTIGSQRLKQELKSPFFVEAAALGRVLSFDFGRIPSAVTGVSEASSFPKRLMVYYLCRMFGGSIVDGLHFQDSEFSAITDVDARQPKFKGWLSKVLALSTDQVIDEYVRLTNIAFGVSCGTPPVFLLDEIQLLCGRTNIVSRFGNQGPQYHTYLSILLTQLAIFQKPVCICAGTNDGNLLSLTEYTSIVPEILSLTTLSAKNEYHTYWAQMTNFASSKLSRPLEMEGDESLINALVYASYQIPRLLLFAHQTWASLRASGTYNREFFIQTFETEAVKFYPEMADIWLSYSTEDLAHIILACSVHHVVKIDSTVPGTQIPWRTLTRNALVFPYLDGCYVFPYGIVWNAKVTSPGKATKKAVEDRCRELVPNLEIQDLFVSYDRLCAHDLYNLGLAYESLFVSSLAVKYYLQLVQFGCADVCLSDIYDLDDEEADGKTLMSDLIVNFSDGISIPAVEKAREFPEHAITHHKLIHNAHYDIIIPAKINNN